MQPNYPQQQQPGYGQPAYPQQPEYGQQAYPQQPSYGDAGSPKANAGAAGVAGVLGLLAGGALVWSLIEYLAGDILSGDVDQWPSEIWVIVISRGALALIILLVAALTLARKVGAAWSLVVFGLLTAGTLLLDAAMWDSATDGMIGLGPFLEKTFEFTLSWSASLVVASGLGLLAALAAIFAGAMKSNAQQQYPGY